jgi:hypothetical protein
MPVKILEKVDLIGYSGKLISSDWLMVAVVEFKI